MINQQQLWDDDAAKQYDTPGDGMFSPDVLGPTVEVLSELAGEVPPLSSRSVLAGWPFPSPKRGCA